MSVKVHTSQGRAILAVCDSDLIGKKFSEGDLQLDLTSSFYKGEEMEEKRILEYFKVVNTVHLVGGKSVALGVKAGMIDERHVLKVDGIPHAQFVRGG